MDEQIEKDITEEVEPEDEQLVYFGDTVKALGDGKLGGYLVRFSSDSEPDIEGDFFDKNTDYGDATRSAVYYNHGMDPVIKRRKLGSAELTTDDIGIWAEAQLNMRDEYEKFIYQMSEAGKQGWSSGTASHLVEKEKSGKATWIRSWPLGLDASLTPTPAEPRNGVQPLKSIKVEPLMESEPMDAPVEESTDQDGSAEPDAEDQTKMKDINEEITMEITEERLQELIGGAVDAGVEKAMKALPCLLYTSPSPRDRS